ncbi:MAG: branched-chain amino acid ABC transporter permease [Eubacteriales bacterium]
MINVLKVLLNLVLATGALFLLIKLLSKVFDWGTSLFKKLTPKTRKILLAGVSLLIIIWPLLVSGSPYVLRTSIIVLMYIVLALSLNYVLGFAGQLSMGHAAFYGVGAYVTALLTVNLHFSFWIALPISAMAAAIFGFVLGIPTLRLKGDYLAITTIGFGEIVRLVIVNWVGLTRGPAGIPGIPSPSFFGKLLGSNTAYYYLILVLVVFTVFISYRLWNSRLGRGLIAVRDDEIAANAIGINPTNLKVLAFVLGAAVAGLAGSFFATFIHYVNPDNFTYMESVVILCMVVLGGVGSIPGVIVGATILALLPEMLRDISTYRYAIYGLLLILMMIIRPQGMISAASLKGGTNSVHTGDERSYKIFRRFKSHK